MKIIDAGVHVLCRNPTDKFMTDVVNLFWRTSYSTLFYGSPSDSKSIAAINDVLDKQRRKGRTINVRHDDFETTRAIVETGRPKPAEARILLVNTNERLDCLVKRYTNAVIAGFAGSEQESGMLRQHWGVSNAVCFMPGKGISSVLYESLPPADIAFHIYWASQKGLVLTEENMPCVFAEGLRTHLLTYEKDGGCSVCGAAKDYKKFQDALLKMYGRGIGLSKLLHCMPKGHAEPSRYLLGSLGTECCLEPLSPGCTQRVTLKEFLRIQKELKSLYR